MPAAGSGKPYSQPLPITGGTQPYNATVTSGTLPTGLALSSTGILSGTPSGVGSFTFTATVADSSTPVQTATQNLTIAVDTLVITTTALPNGIVGVPYNGAIATAGGTLPLSFSAATAAFPPGLAIQQPAANSGTGALAGTPTLPGHYTFTESVSDSSTPTQTATQYYVMDIFPAGTAVPATVTFLTPPQNSVGGQLLAGSPIRVHVADANNAPITGASVAISFNGAPPCSSAVLSGTLNGITNGNGNALFFDLSIDRGQVGYTPLATTGNASAVSPPFTVNGFCPVPTAVYVGPFASATLLNSGKALIAGGVDLNSNDTAVAQLYDPATGTFAATGSMQLARREHTATLLPDGRVLITGGRGGVNNLSPSTATAEIYDPATGTFTFTSGPMNVARYGHTATLLTDGTVLIAGGTTTGLGRQNTAELFNPQTGVFTVLAFTMTTARFAHTSTLLPNGRVLLAGGLGPASGLSSAETYDPVAQTFTAVVGSMSGPRVSFGSVLLPTGKVLLMGGDDGANSATATADLYDPTGGTFVATGPMSVPREFFTASLLPNGQVLIAGGVSVFTATSTNLASAEIYDPATGVFSPTGTLSSGRAQHVAVVLKDGSVLLNQGATGGSAEIYYSSARSNIYVSNRAANLINVLDASTGSVVTSIPNVPTPQLMAFTPNGNVLYVTTYESSGPAYAIATNSNAVVATIPVGAQDHGVAVSPDGSRAYVTSSGSVYVISTATNQVIATIGIGGSPTDLAIRPDGRFAYVTDISVGGVRVIDTSTNAVTTTIPVGAFPVGIAASPDNQWVYAANYSGGTVSLIRTSDNTVVKTIAVGPADWALAFTVDGTKAYVTSETSNNIWVINTATQTATSVPVGVPTSGLAIHPNGRYVFAGSKTGVLLRVDTTTGAVSTFATGLGEAVAVAFP